MAIVFRVSPELSPRLSPTVVESAGTTPEHPWTENALPLEEMRPFFNRNLGRRLGSGGEGRSRQTPPNVWTVGCQRPPKHGLQDPPRPFNQVRVAFPSFGPCPCPNLHPRPSAAKLPRSRLPTTCIRFRLLILVHGWTFAFCYQNPDRDWLPSPEVHNSKPGAGEQS